jgi:hypothetical protein
MLPGPLLYCANSSPIIVSPASISLGWDDPEQMIFSKVATLQITNPGPIQRTYSLSITLPMVPGGGYPQPGITAEISPANFTLAPNETRNLTFTINVDNNMVPSGTEEPGSYEGKVVIQTPAKTINVPFAFIKIPKLEIEFDEAPWIVLIHNRLDRGWVYAYPGTILSTLLPEGIYDVMVSYDDCVTEIVREGINVVGNMSLFINKSEAIYTANITTIDENGIIIDPDLLDPEFDALIHKSSGMGHIILGWKRRQYYFSPLSTDYDWDWSTQFFRENQEKLYSFNCYSEGITSDLTYENQPEDLKPVDYKYHVDPDVNEIFLNSWIGPTHGALLFSCQYWDRQLTDPFTQRAYYMPIPYPDFNFGGHMQYVYKYENGSPGEFLYQTAIYAVENDPGLGFDFIRGYIQHDSQNPIFQTTSGYIDIGLSPYWFGEFKNSVNSILLRPFTGTWLWLYLNQAGDLRPHFNLGYQLYQYGNLIKQGEIDGIGETYTTHIDIDDPGVYTLKVPYTNYYVKDIQGAALMSATFDTQAQDKNPPYMSHFNILCEGRPTNTVGFGKKASIKFKVYDDNGLSQVSLYYSTGGGWFPLTLTNSGNQYTALIPPFPVRTYVSLRLVANDTSGNNLTYELNPAFFIKPTPLDLFQIAR